MKGIGWLSTTAYRLDQVRQQLGFVGPLSTKDEVEVASWLPASALPLFRIMSQADQQHSLRVCRGLQARGYTEKDLLVAALLHDVGKAEGRVPFWTRPAIVIGKRCAPRLLMRVIVALDQLDKKSLSRWRRSLSYAWWHAEVGAKLAEAVGLSERAILYIRTHHDPHGPAAALHAVDEVS